MDFIINYNKAIFDEGVYVYPKIKKEKPDLYKLFDSKILSVIAGGYSCYILGLKDRAGDVDIFTSERSNTISKDSFKFSYSSDYTIKSTSNIRFPGNPTTCTLNVPIHKPNEIIHFKNYDFNTEWNSGYWIMSVKNHRKNDLIDTQLVHVDSVFVNILKSFFYSSLINIHISASEARQFRNIIRFIYGMYIVKYFDIVACQSFIMHYENKNGTIDWLAFRVESPCNIDTTKLNHNDICRFIFEKSIVCRKHFDNYECVLDSIKEYTISNNITSAKLTESFKLILTTPKEKIIELLLNKITEDDIFNRILCTITRVNGKYKAPYKIIDRSLVLNSLIASTKHVLEHIYTIIYQKCLI